MSITVRRATSAEIRHLQSAGWIDPSHTFLADRDLTFVALLGPDIVGCSVLRPMWWVHCLETGQQSSPATRLNAARSLLAYGLGFTDAYRPPPSTPFGLLFHIRPDNAGLERMVTGPSAVVEPDGLKLIRVDNFNPSLKG